MSITQEDRNKLAKLLIELPLLGALDITMSLRRYDILEIAIDFIENDTFKMYGFKPKIDDTWNFIKKMPYCTQEFCEKYKLLNKDNLPAYGKYEFFMKHNKTW
jgi:hypothetical protein